MTRSRLTGALLSVALTAGGALLLAPTAAHADTASTTTRESFATGADGWTPSATYTGLCLPQLLCPAISSDFVATGGSDGDGDGYLATTFSSLASTVAGTTTSGWLSPAFTYTGVGGEVPTSLSLDLSKRVTLGGLLGLDVLNDSSYQVDLVDTATGGAVSVIPATELTDDDAWTAAPPAQISPSRLTIGHSYQLRVSTTYHSVATVVASGEVGYDDVRLSAERTTSTDTTTNTHTETVVYLPASTPPQVEVPGVYGITSTRQLRVLVRTQGMPKSVQLKGNRVTFKVACFQIASPKPCKYAVQGLSAGKGSPVSTGRKALSVQPSATRKVSLTLKPRYVASYRHAKRMTIRAKVRVGVFKVTVVKKVRLVHR